MYPCGACGETIYDRDGRDYEPGGTLHVHRDHRTLEERVRDLERKVAELERK